MEVDAIADLFSSPGHILCGVNATRAAIEQAIENATNLHFACHAFFQPFDPLSSGLVLSNGEQLTVRDLLSGQRLRHARLAVLSACQTAVTDLAKLPEESLGLPLGFLQAGVPGVVGTLWPVDDLSTALFMIVLYNGHLKLSMSPMDALRRAQRWLRDVTNEELTVLFDFYRRSADNLTGSRIAYETAHARFREHALRDPAEKPYSNPYYWAPFVFYGA